MKRTSKQPHSKPRSAIAMELFLRNFSGPLPTKVLHDFRPPFPTYTQRRDADLNRVPAKGLTADDYQATGSCWLIEHGCGILGDKAGYGKSKQLIDAVDYLSAHTVGPYRTLILCKATMVDGWANQIRMWCPGASINIYRGTDRALTNLLDKCAFTIMTYETFRADWESITAIEWDVAAFDEPQKKVRAASRINGAPSMVGERIHHLNARRRYAITASPVLRSLADSWNLLTWLGIETMPWEDFVPYHLKVAEIRINKYTTRKKITGNTQDGELRIKQMLLKHMIKRSKEVDLPPVTIQNINVPMHTAEVAKYSELQDKFIEVTNAIAEGLPVVGRSRDTLLLRMRQAISDSSSKLDEAADIVDDAMAVGDKVVIFTQHLETLRRLWVRFKDNGIAYVCGTVSTAVRAGKEVSDRQLQIDKFQNDPTCRIMICTIETMGEGVTLTAGNVVIFMDRTTSSEQNDQCIKRVDRIGQTKPITAYILKSVMIKGSKEHHIEDALDRVLESNAALVSRVVG